MINTAFDFNSPAYAQTLSQFESNDKSKLGIIFIEDITDKQFWQKIAIKHEVKLYSENGKTITGKSKLLQICNKHQLIAIDSDFDELCPNHREESIIFSEKSSFILKTYTHGRENLTFSPNCLHEILKTKFQLYIDNHDNPILAIFNQLSEIWFEPYQKFLYLYNQKRYSHDDWINTIKFQNNECQNIAINQNFDDYRNRLSAFNNQLNRQIIDQNDFNLFCNELNNKEFNQQTVWVFIRCHDFENQFVIPLMKEISKNRQSKELGNMEIQYTQKEIGDRKKEVANYFKTINSLQTVLYHYFYDVYFNIAKNSDRFLTKIIYDYQNIITS